MTTMQPTWREERRRDRMAEAQIGREDEAARTQARIAATEASARLRRDELQVRSAGRRTARKQRSARWGARVAWLREHVTGLLFVPVITVPGALAWTAMAAYGVQVFGPAGVTLPAFSEGAMWAFAGATTITRHRHPQRPVWHLRLGTVVFAGFGAVLNFSHGITPDSGALRGVTIGAVMALISIAGVVAHQLITAGPRRAASERAGTRIARASNRRERAIQRAALRTAAAVLEADGTARLVHEPATVKLTRHWGRARLTDLPQRAALPAAGPAPEAHPWPRSAPVLSLPAAPRTEPVLSRAERSETAAPGVAQTRPARRPAASSKPAARQAQTSAAKPSEKRAAAERLLRDNPSISAADLVAQTGVSKATAKRIRTDAPRRLHVAGG